LENIVERSFKKKGQVESARINRHRVGDERALHERRICSIKAVDILLESARDVS
jgi:hypothetical protein